MKKSEEIAYKECPECLFNIRVNEKGNIPIHNYLISGKPCPYGRSKRKEKQSDT